MSQLGMNTKIADVTVCLTDGRWCIFSANDLRAVSDFCFTESKFWPLLEFITSLAPAPRPEDPVSDEGGEL